MVITELTAIEYLEFIKNVIRDNNFKFLLLSVVRYGDNRKYFQELEEYWSSIDNLTARKIIFLNFTTNSFENEENYLYVGNGELIGSKRIQTIKQYDLQELLEKKSRAGSYKRQAKESGSYYFREMYEQELQSIKLKYLPKLKDKLSQTIDESATQLLEYLGKKEADAPFLYLLHLRENEEYYFALNDIYAHYSSLYDFIKTLTIKIEQAINLELDSDKYLQIIKEMERSIFTRKWQILVKQKQLDSIPSDLLAVENYLASGKFDFKKQKFYLESIIKRRKYELGSHLKLFDYKYNDYINRVIREYSNKDLENLEINLQNWIDTEENYCKESPILVQELNNKISQNTAKIGLLYKELFDKNYQSNNRTMKNFKVALTFAGENRGFVEQVAVDLEVKLGKGNIFYDNFFQAELARMDLDIFLQDIYHNKSDFIVVFLSEDYEKKEWCGLEWRSIRDLIKKKQSNKIILVKLSDFNLEGIFSIDGYLDGVTNNPMAISELINNRICS